MAGVEYPYTKKIVADGVDIVEAEDHNKQEEQIGALTDARGGTWVNDLARPVPDPNNPYPFGYNVDRGDYEFWNGTTWIQLEIVSEKGVANGYAPLDGSSKVPLVNLPSTPPTAHAPSHQNGGLDEIDLTGLSGLLADQQYPKSHGGDHMGGSDPVTPAGIGADTPADRNIAIGSHSAIPAAHHTRPVDGELLPAPHAPSHQTGGVDEINVGGLLGILANAQIPQAHKDTHKTGGTDSFLSTDILQARVKRFEDGGGFFWELGALAPNQRLVTDALGNIIGVTEISPKKVVFAITRTAIYGQYAVADIASNGQGGFSFYIPDDFNTLVSLKIIGIVTPAAAGVNKSIDLYSQYS